MFRKVIKEVSDKIGLTVHETYWFLGVQVFLLTFTVTLIYFGTSGKLFWYLPLYSVMISLIGRKVRTKVILYLLCCFLVLPPFIFIIVLLYSASVGDLSGLIYWFIPIALLMGDSFVISSFLTVSKDEIKSSLSGLNDGALKVYDIICNTGEIFQYQIVEKTGFSKATVSRAVNTLKKRALIEVERKGMGNKIRKKTD